MNPIAVYQIYFDQKSEGTLDPDFLKYLNEGRDDYFENGVIKKIYDILKDTDVRELPKYIGITSWKQKDKTNFTGKEIIDHIQKDIDTGQQKDVYIYSPIHTLKPEIDNSSNPEKLISSISCPDIWTMHRNRFIQIDTDNQLLNNAKVLPFNIFDGKWIFCHCNYWIAKTSIFMEYCEKVLLPTIEFYERPDIRSSMPKWFTHSHEQRIVNSCCFTMEGLFGAFLAHTNYSYEYLCKRWYRTEYKNVKITGYNTDSDKLISSILPTTILPALSQVTDNKLSGKIGVYLQRNETAEAFCASDRIRGEWIVKNSDNRMEFFDAKKTYDVVIFHVACKAIATHGRIKILDICDRVWKHNLQQFKELIKPIDAIIVSTEELKKEAAIIIPDKPIYVIPDGHDFNHYKHSIINTHTRKAQEVVWFGYAENAACLEPFINYIKSSGIKLKVICQNKNISPLQHADIFVKWDINTYISEIAKSDFALLPPSQSYKSNNKNISAMLCGIPVAKTKEDIARFMIPEERQLEINQKWNTLSQYSVLLRINDYIDVINLIKKPENKAIDPKPIDSKSIEPKSIDPVHIPIPITQPVFLKTGNLKVYSAICGNFDNPRNDIITFTDEESDKFKDPVMNAKIYKILSHKYFLSKISIFVDGNISLLIPPDQLVKELLKDADMALFKHPWRRCLYEEHGHAIKRVSAPFKPLMNEQVIDYRNQGMPMNFGLGECGMLIRRNNDVVNEFNERWWAEICRYTSRDQMSFPYVLWKMKDRIKINFIDGNVRDHNFFKYIIH